MCDVNSSQGERRVGEINVFGLRLLVSNQCIYLFLWPSVQSRRLRRSQPSCVPSSLCVHVMSVMQPLMCVAAGRCLPRRWCRQRAQVCRDLHFLPVPGPRQTSSPGTRGSFNLSCQLRFMSFVSLPICPAGVTDQPAGLRFDVCRHVCVCVCVSLCEWMDGYIGGE